jgi:hypothetical protein
MDAIVIQNFLELSLFCFEIELLLLDQAVRICDRKHYPGYEKP